MRRIIDYKIIARVGYNPVIFVTLDSGTTYKVGFKPSTMHHFVAACSMLQFPHVQYDATLNVFRVISNTRLEEIALDEEIGNEEEMS